MSYPMKYSFSIKKKQRIYIYFCQYFIITISYKLNSQKSNLKDLNINRYDMIVINTYL